MQCLLWRARRHNEVQCRHVPGIEHGANKHDCRLTVRTCADSPSTTPIAWFHAASVPSTINVFRPSAALLISRNQHRPSGIPLFERCPGAMCLIAASPGDAGNAPRAIRVVRQLMVINTFSRRRRWNRSRPHIFVPRPACRAYPSGGQLPPLLLHLPVVTHDAAVPVVVLIVRLSRVSSLLYMVADLGLASTCCAATRSSDN